MFKENYPSVFERFLNWGFFVSEDTDEIANLRFNNKKAVFSDKFYRLIMNPTTDCVFNCWYCNQHSQDKGRMSGETIAKIRKHIDYMVNVDKITGLHLDWFGGEPHRRQVKAESLTINSIWQHHIFSKPLAPKP